MKLSFAAVFADAAALWRAERHLIVPVVGVFLFLPILGLVILSLGFVMPTSATPEQMREALNAFYRTNLVWLLAITLVTEFGAFALLKLLLGPPDTVQRALTGAMLRLAPYILLGLANGALIQLGLAAFVVPGLYIFGRTWMMGAAYAAEPELGLLKAAERGFRLSGGNGWRVALLGSMVGIVAGGGTVLILVVVTALAVMAGGSDAVRMLTLLPVAAAAAAGLTAFHLVRIVAYRRLAGSSTGI